MIRLLTGCALLGAGLLGACGGGSNPFDNPPDVANPTQVGGQKLSFAYFQKCIDPILLAKLTITHDGTTSTNTCADAGYHDNATDTGDALRVVPSTQPLDLANATNSPDVVRASDMYKNFYSSQGSTVVGVPTQSRLFTKPQLLGVLHGGGLIFASDEDPNAKLIAYWISHPMPAGHDEFSVAGNALFTPADAETGECNIQ